VVNPHDCRVAQRPPLVLMVALVYLFASLTLVFYGVMLRVLYPDATTEVSAGPMLVLSGLLLVVVPLLTLWKVTR